MHEELSYFKRQKIQHKLKNVDAILRGCFWKYEALVQENCVRIGRISGLYQVSML